MAALLSLALWTAAVVALVYFWARAGTWAERRILARLASSGGAWGRFIGWIAVSLAIAMAFIGLGQFDGIVLRVVASVSATGVLLAGSILSVRGFSRGWAAFALPAVLLVGAWVSSAVLYVSYEAGWQDNSGEMGNGAAFLGAVVFTPVILLLGVPAGFMAGRPSTPAGA